MSGHSRLTVREAAELLGSADNILIVTHKAPDGDALGCAFALWAALSGAKKKVRVGCPGSVPKMFSFLTGPYGASQGEADDFPPDFIVTVDTAAPELLGTMRELAARTDLAIDHHGSHAFFAKHTLLDGTLASCAELVYLLMLELGAEITRYAASALYAGISTDTGCYLYRNTTAHCHAVTAALMERGIDSGMLNKILFETKSRALVALERMAMESLEFYCGGKIAMLTVTREMMARSGAEEADLTFITPLPRKIEGVEAGVVFRELPGGDIKCSIRTALSDAGRVAALFGGGGHRGAAGFECGGALRDVKALVIRALTAEIGRLERGSPS